MDPVFFPTPSHLRAWLEAHGDTETELWIGLYKVDSGRGGPTYQEALDEALCAGWIDGVRRRLDEEGYAIRFTPRKERSRWSEVNRKRASELRALGRMQPRGLDAFRAAGDPPAGEARPQALSPELEALFRQTPGAWDFFQAQPPSYRRLASLWVMSAKREPTRLKRLEILVRDSEAGRRIDPLAPGKG